MFIDFYLSRENTSHFWNFLLSLYTYMSKNKEIQLVSLSDLVPISGYEASKACFNEHFGVVLNHGAVAENEWMRPWQPYRNKDWRLVRTRSGRSVYDINLRRYEMGPDTVNILPPGTLIMRIEEADGHSAELVSIDNLDALANHVAFGHDVIFNVSAEDGERLHTYFDMLLKLMRANQTPLASMQQIAMALAEEILALREKSEKLAPVSESDSNQKLYERFLDLLNTYGTRRHEIPFYANRLFVSPNHLSKVVKKISNQTPGWWISNMITLEAKMLLLHSQLMVYEIAERLEFPNTPLFCRFFKNQTGMTPSEFRQM